MRSITRLLSLCLFGLISIATWAYDFTVENKDGVTIYYNITSSSSPKTVEVTNGGSIYSSVYTEDSINIPNTVTYNGNTYEVTGVGEYAFKSARHVKSITLPKCLMRIGDRAFAGCDSLTSVTIPNSVESIGSYAFNGCYALTLVTIPNSVTSIGDEAFEGCSGLTSVIIPNSVDSIGYSAFAGCTGLTSVTIGNSVTSIGETAFHFCKGLTSITIPNSVESIGRAAFAYCSGLTSITIPNSVESIGVAAFGECSGLTSVIIPNSVESIGRGAFACCSGLTSITVENGNAYYDSRNGCNAIIEKSANTLVAGCQNTIIPNSVTSIGYSAFEGCSGVTSITIPNSVTSIGHSAFYGCSGLTSVTIPNSVKSIGNSAFNRCSGLTSITIPNSVTSIGDAAFASCTGLTSVTIGNSVTSIGEYAFSSCENANIILTSKNAPTVSGGFISVKTVYYPKCYDWSYSYPYHAYTTLITNVNGSYSFENIDRWSELEIKENCKEYKVIADVSAFLLSASYTRTFNNHEWQAWYIPADVPFSSLSANFEVAKFSDTQVSANEIEIEAVTSGTLAANTPYLVRLKDDKATGEYSIVADESAGLKETVENEVNIGSNYKLKTTYRELSGEELKGKYALSEGKFKKAGDSATLKPFRVYLEPVTTGAADVLDLVMDGATDITLTPSSGKGAETIYNLNGQAVGEDYKGVVIKNGKKVFKN